MHSGTAALLLSLLSYQFTITSQSSWWLSDTELFFEDPAEGATIYNTLKDEYTRISFTAAKDNSISSYSRDLKYAAEFIIRPEAYRNPTSITFSVLIHNIDNNTEYTEGPSSYGEVDSFTWSHGSAYAFANETAVYYVASPGEHPIRISDSEDGNIMHETHHFTPVGEIIDEYISAKEGVNFSPSDKYVAYFSSESSASDNSTSDNSTNEVIMTTYDRSEKYDYHYQMEYVKTGEEDHTIHYVYIWDVEMKAARLMNVQMRQQSSAYYALTNSWVVIHGKELLLMVWANRWQNETTITLCDYETATCSRIYEHKYERRQWASHADYSNIVYSNSSIFVILPLNKQDNAWQHITKIGITTDYKLQSISHVPSGEYDIRKIIAYRSEDDTIVYEAQAPNPWNRLVYSAPAGENSMHQEDRCLTCSNYDCSYVVNGATVSPAKNLTISFWCSGPAPPHQKMVIDNNGQDDGEIRMISEPYTHLNRTEWIIDKFELSSGYEAIIRIYEGDSEQELVPVTLFVYGGPDSNQVIDEFEEDPYPIGYKHAIVKIDVRGSGGRGWKYRSEIYGRLVTVEVEDTIEAMEMVLEKYPRFDKDRVGVFGWSYGGTMAIALVEKAPQYFFKCAIAVAPVTNFYHYNAMYTESYMGDAPSSAYTDLSANVTAFRDTKLLLMHGMRDDIVIFRHAALLIESLQQNDIPFELMVYPNADHQLEHNVTNHYEHLFHSFLTTCYE